MDKKSLQLRTSRRVGGANNTQWYCSFRDVLNFSCSALCCFCPYCSYRFHALATKYHPPLAMSRKNIRTKNQRAKYTLFVPKTKTLCCHFFPPYDKPLFCQLYCRYFDKRKAHDNHPIHQT